MTGFGYEHDEPWQENMALFQHFTDRSQGVRRLGAAAIDMCHIAIGADPAHVPSMLLEDWTNPPKNCMSVNFRHG